jgi:hypothetical protein
VDDAAEVVAQPYHFLVVQAVEQLVVRAGPALCLVGGPPGLRQLDERHAPVVGRWLAGNEALPLELGQQLGRRLPGQAQQERQLSLCDFWF